MIVRIYMLRLRQDGIGTVGALWERSGSAVEALWGRCGSAVGALWDHCGSAVGALHPRRGAKHHPEHQKMCFSNTFAIGFCQPQNDLRKNGSRRSKNTSLSVSCPREGKRAFFQNSKKTCMTPSIFGCSRKLVRMPIMNLEEPSQDLFFQVNVQKITCIFKKIRIIEHKPRQQNIKLQGFVDFDDCGDLHALAQTGWS